MPMIEVIHETDSLTDKQYEALSERLTKTLLMIEGGIDSPQTRSISYVFFTEIPKGRWAIGGRFDDTYKPIEGRLLIQVTVPEGALKRRNLCQRVADDVHEALREELALPKETPPNRAVWVQMREQDEGTWAAGGKIWTFADIQAFAQSSVSVENPELTVA